MLDIFKDIFLTDLLRYLIVAGAAFLIFWVIGRQYFKQYLIQGQFPKSKKLREEFGYSMSTVIIFSLIGFGVDTATRAGYTQFYFDKSEYSECWYYASFFCSSTDT